jgi:hypothetical protein
VVPAQSLAPAALGASPAMWRTVAADSRGARTVAVRVPGASGPADSGLADPSVLDARQPRSVSRR